MKYGHKMRDFMNACIDDGVEFYIQLKEPDGISHIKSKKWEDI